MKLTKKDECSYSISNAIRTLAMVRVAEPANHRQAKANDTYYLLKKTEAPTVIVECGFLSNWEECAKLRNEDYQAKLVWAIQMGILKYLNKK